MKELDEALQQAYENGRKHALSEFYLYAESEDFKKEVKREVERLYYEGKKFDRCEAVAAVLHSHCKTFDKRRHGVEMREAIAAIERRLINKAIAFVVEKNLITYTNKGIALVVEKNLITYTNRDAANV